MHWIKALIKSVFNVSFFCAVIKIYICCYDSFRVKYVWIRVCVSHAGTKCRIKCVEGGSTSAWIWRLEKRSKEHLRTFTQEAGAQIPSCCCITFIFNSKCIFCCCLVHDINLSVYVKGININYMFMNSNIVVIACIMFLLSSQINRTFKSSIPWNHLANVLFFHSCCQADSEFKNSDSWHQITS